MQLLVQCPRKDVFRHWSKKLNAYNGWKKITIPKAIVQRHEDDTYSLPEGEVSCTNPFEPCKMLSVIISRKPAS